jgi:hypothetical protein
MLRRFVVNAIRAALIARTALWLWNAVCLKSAINPVLSKRDFIAVNVRLWTAATVNRAASGEIADHVECAAKA